MQERDLGVVMSGAPTQGCSFCGKTEDEVQKLERGTAALICNECLDLRKDILPDDGPAGRHPSLVCSFCGKDNRRRLVAGPTTIRTSICSIREAAGGTVAESTLW